MLKILQARLQQYVNRELLDDQAEFRKGRGTRDQIANICWIIDKAIKFQKETSTPASLTTLKSLTVWIKTNCGNSLRDGNTKTSHWPPEKSVCRLQRRNRIAHVTVHWFQPWKGVCQGCLL